MMVMILSSGNSGDYRSNRENRGQQAKQDAAVDKGVGLWLACVAGVGEHSDKGDAGDEEQQDSPEAKRNGTGRSRTARWTRRKRVGIVRGPIWRGMRHGNSMRGGNLRQQRN
jgi:hypothetical protein